jgi:hypothetical protein
MFKVVLNQVSEAGPGLKAYRFRPFDQKPADAEDFEPYAANLQITCRPDDDVGEFEVGKEYYLTLEEVT